ncbi:unnamed protein product [Prorocentrum cordatum]|uniref:RecF/RecN/SMC N-terminal domain-containing protein n=1 Tax=Prorocentrum cordatum TaxID=2364126 RepID=A0ABN9PC86_9DINO|nr:unnamed protein product [Polarella glacialis]
MGEARGADLRRRRVLHILGKIASRKAGGLPSLRAPGIAAGLPAARLSVVSSPCSLPPGSSRACLETCRGPRPRSFSSIVGPNGSGKSNTIDALLFVFGKRAKKMRLNKVSELIHQSAELPNVPSAKVEVTFQDIMDTGDGPEDYEIVEGSTLCVGREAFRNNQSKYYMDGKASNFTEVTQVLRKRGVDLEHNRFLILQGEVEQISLMKPKALTPHEDGLLEYLEDCFCACGARSHSGL